MHEENQITFSGRPIVAKIKRRAEASQQAQEVPIAQFAMAETEAIVEEADSGKTETSVSASAKSSEGNDVEEVLGINVVKFKRKKRK